MHRPSSARKTVLVANASLSSGLDWSECSNVVLIETAVRYEMVAKESSVHDWLCPVRRLLETADVFTKGCLGVQLQKQKKVAQPREK